MKRRRGAADAARRGACLVTLCIASAAAASAANPHDQALTLFSPAGRLFQVEYALKAVDFYGSPCIAVQGRDCCVAAAKRTLPDDLVDPASVTSVHRVAPGIAFVASGAAGDVLYQSRRAAAEALEFKQQFGYRISSELLTRRLADSAQLRTQHAATRPLGIASLVLGCDLVENNNSENDVKDEKDENEDRDGRYDEKDGLQAGEDLPPDSGGVSQQQLRSSEVQQRRRRRNDHSKQGRQKQTEPRLFQVDPTGQSFSAWAAAVGSGAAAAAKWLERRYEKKAAAAVPQTREECIDLALRALQMAAGKTTLRAVDVEIMVVTAHSGVTMCSEAEVARHLAAAAAETTTK